MGKNLAQNLARNIRRRREELNLSQSELAQISHCTEDEIKIVEDETIVPDLTTLVKLRDPLMISTDHAMFDPDPKCSAPCILYRYSCAFRKKFEEGEYALARKVVLACYHMLYSPNPMVRRESYSVLAPLVEHMSYLFGPTRRGEVVQFEKRNANRQAE